MHTKVLHTCSYLNLGYSSCWAIAHNNRYSVDGHILAVVPCPKYYCTAGYFPGWKFRQSLERSFEIIFMILNFVMIQSRICDDVIQLIVHVLCSIIA